MKKTKIIACILLLTFVTFGLTACLVFYSGPHLELYSVAVNNIFGADGFGDDGEAPPDPTIDIIEVDDYGRVLFFYNEYPNYSKQRFRTAIVIMQRYDNPDDYVYYYQDDCYLPYLGNETPYPVGYRNFFSEDDVTALKELNDWNKELNLDKCTRAACSHRKPHGALKIKEKEFEKAIKPVAQKMGYKGDDTIYRYCEYCNTDKYGRELYYVYGVGRDVYGEGVSTTSTDQEFEFAIIFNPDKTCPEENVYVLTDKASTFDALKLLKQTAGWNQPYSAN